MTEAQRKQAAKEFSEFWKGTGYEKGQSQTFWLMLLRKVFGMDEPEKYIRFEDQVHLDSTSFIDGYIDATHVLIEQKSLGKSLRKPIKQSDGTLLTPFQQAQRYSAALPYSMRPRWIVTCNFESFLIYDMEKPTGEPEEIRLEDLQNEYYRLNFLIKQDDSHIQHEIDISVQAGALVGKMYAAFLKQYKDPNAPAALKSLNKLCVRLVFCLFAEDADIFGKHMMFHDYLMSAGYKKARRALIDLFDVFATPIDARDPYLDEDVAAFPYVRGLFEDEQIEIPQFTEELYDLLLECSEFDWSQISPTIFGAVFESTLNPETRRSGGMHYTSIENIHKVIDPLFLDDLKAEFEAALEIKALNPRKKALLALQDKMTGLKFLDPACGSGNFLTETYISLRRLENKIISEIHQGQITMGEALNPIRVTIDQFYGIEINDFAVSVAQTALWIAESQMMTETEEIVHMALEFLPLRSYAHVVEGNALRMDWESLVPKEKLNYIMGNPPFVGYSLQTKEQKDDMLSIYVDEKGKPYKTAGKIDYVAGWYFKAAKLMEGTNIRTAFVSTNSITQGEQVAGVWKPLYDRFGIHIDFAHRTFRWDNEATDKAQVHCVIVGFSNASILKQPLLISNGVPIKVKTINAYLAEAPDVFIETVSKTLCDVPEMLKGSSPVDGGYFFVDDPEPFINKEPNAKKYIKRFLGAREYLHGMDRWCLWLDGITPKELGQMPLTRERVHLVREFRLKSTKAATRKFAEYSTRFMEMRQPTTEYILVPRHTSENRKYIPFGFMNSDIICGDANSMIPNATVYHFGVMISNVHMAWVKTVCGRIKSDFRYSNDVVYNNFPWPTPTDEQRKKIEQTAQAILDARALYPDSSLADLYDEALMPPELRKAHQANDKAVMQAYGFDIKTTTESTCVAALMQMYSELTKTK